MTGLWKFLTYRLGRSGWITANPDEGFDSPRGTSGAAVLGWRAAGSSNRDNMTGRLLSSASPGPAWLGYHGMDEMGVRLPLRLRADSSIAAEPSTIPAAPPRPGTFEPEFDRAEVAGLSLGPGPIPAASHTFGACELKTRKTMEPSYSIGPIPKRLRNCARLSVFFGPLRPGPAFLGFRFQRSVRGTSHARCRFFSRLGTEPGSESKVSTTAWVHGITPFV